MSSIAPRGGVHIGKMFQAQNGDSAVSAKSRFICVASCGLEEIKNDLCFKCDMPRPYHCPITLTDHPI